MVTLTDTRTDEIHVALKKYFGYDHFRGRQQDIILNVLQGKDAFVIMPTGAGKSLCYQLPAIIQPGTALVISPLIALMKNQVDQMQGLGIEAGFLNSSMTRAEYEGVKKKALDGVLKLLYVAPETLVRDEFIEFMQQFHVSFVAIDEAHCISEWGHDFRPEYRRIRPILNQIGHVPVVALTATATPKVQMDIQANLNIEAANVFKTSFNRTNLYYEIRPKTNPVPEIVKYIKGQKGRSGIIYCLSRRKVEELAELLNMNGIHSVPYHAGLDSDTRTRHQDMFLKEDVQVVVATIAFGMGIDKPDVRFVIHYDVPKSIESYYQETGRGGRDGKNADCLLFYQFNDIIKLEKFMKDKPVSEREAGKHLLYEMAAFAESGVCRRKQLLHYFGEQYDDRNCNSMCDNCRYPPETYEAQDEVTMALKAARDTGGKFPLAYLVSILRGLQSQQAKDMQHTSIDSFGQGKHREEKEWKAIFTQLLVNDFLHKDISDYGVISLAERGKEYLANPTSYKLVKFRDFDKLEREHGHAEEVKGYDEVLYDTLLKLRKDLAKKKGLPPYVIFQEQSLEDMAIKYPITMEEFENIIGVGKGKAQKFAKPFIEVISKYVEDNEIIRPNDVVVKTQGKNSGDKLFVIQQIDRKTPLGEIARAKGISMDDLLHKIEQIVYAGSRMNLDYYIEEVIDDDKVDEIIDYFKKSESDNLDLAAKELGSDFSPEEIQLVRIKFYSEHAN